VRARRLADVAEEQGSEFDSLINNPESRTADWSVEVGRQRRRVARVRQCKQIIPSD
jgi:hypothetical protein